jgi:signal transduction histidine kinase
MAETICSTGDSPKTTPVSRRSAIRALVGGGVLVALAVALVAFERWRLHRVAHLANAWAEMAPDDFNVAVRLRETIQRMDGALLRFQLTEDETARDEFARDARRFSELALKAKQRPLGPSFSAGIAEVERRFDVYLADTRELLERAVRGLRRDTAIAVDTAVKEKSRALRSSVQQLVETHNNDVSAFLLRQRLALDSWQRATGLVWAAEAMLVLCAFLFWRGIGRRGGADGPPDRASMARQERLASLGVLAAGVAHEIRNPLTALKFRLFSLKKALPPSLVEHEDLLVLSREINRLERIVKDFLEFARPAEPRRTSVHAAQLMQEVHDLLRSEFEKRGIQTRLEVDPGAWVSADRQQLQQVLINLLQNAAESTPAGGRVTLAVRQGAARLFKRARSMVIFEVADTGQGIPAGNESRIFDPFFSTKEGGSGLGLSIAARIAEMHEGHLQFASQPGRGTTFTLVLPKANPHES